MRTSAPRAARAQSRLRKAPAVPAALVAASLWAAAGAAPASGSVGEYDPIDPSSTTVACVPAVAPAPGCAVAYAPAPPAAPVTILMPRRERRTAGPRVKFSFTSDQPGSTFECRLDGAPFRPCSSPFRRTVRPGRHVFRVRAINPAGVPDPTPVAFHWRLVAG